MGGNYATEYAAILVVIGAAAAVVAKAANKAWSPVKKIKDVSEETDKALEGRIEALEDHMEHVDVCLDNDNERLKTLDADSKLNLRMNLQMITHEVDGNHIEKLKELRDEAQDYLIGR